MNEDQLVKAEDISLSTIQNLPSSYANGFNVMAGNADIVITLLLNGEPTQVINMSFTTAKTFAQGLNNVIQFIENKTGMDIKTTHHIDKSLNETNQS